MAKKTRIEDIDSEAVINSFRLDDTSIQPEARSTGRERSCPASERSEYKKPFLHPPRTPKRSRNARAGTASRKNWIMTQYSYAVPISRQGSASQVYIRKEYHDRIQKMLHVIGGNEVTIAAFLDNVLTHHLHTVPRRDRRIVQTAHGIL